MRVLLTGAGGQLGRQLPGSLDGHVVLSLRHEDLDITHASEVLDAFEDFQPDAVINAAAFVRVDDCEDAASKAFTVNTIGVANLVAATLSAGATLVHLSTDYIFDGQKTSPYLEGDIAKPLNIYGISKLAAEHIIQANLEKYYIVRTSGLFGATIPSNQGRDFVSTMLRLAGEGTKIRVVHDQQMSPTWIPALADKISWLVTTENHGIWHVTCNGQCSWFEFAQSVFKILGVSSNLAPVSSEAYASTARRPKYSVLGHQRLIEVGADDMPHWRDALESCLIKLGYD